MSEYSAQYWLILDELRSAHDASELVALLDGISRATSDNKLSEEESLRLRINCLTEAKRSTRHDASLAETIIHKYLLPECLAADKNAETSIRIDRGRARELVRDWIEQYPESLQARVRKSVIDRLCQELHTSNAIAACWVLGAIGFRDDEAFLELNRLIDEPNELGRAALETLVDLSPPVESKPAMIAFIKTLLNSAHPEYASYALDRLSSQDTVELTEQLLDRLEPESGHFHIALAQLAGIADRYPDDEVLQERAWDRMRQH